MATRKKHEAKKPSSTKKSPPVSTKKVSVQQLRNALADLGFAESGATQTARWVVVEVAREPGESRARELPIRRTGEKSAPALVRRAEIIAHATEALDGQVNAMLWLQAPNPHLGEKTPLDVLMNGAPDDAERVDELLYGLEYGMYN
jgi:hypothetical protein